MKFIFLLTIMMMFACGKKQPYNTIGVLERYDPALDAILDTTAKAEIIAEGFLWSEGPLWMDEQRMLLFSDVPANTVYKWTAEKGKEVYLSPSGYTGGQERTGETGANGLIFDTAGRLVLCQHGNRQMARMEAPLDKPEPKFTALADRYQGRRFSSPNDAAYHSGGDLYFTDPPYGLTGQDDDTEKEQPYNGVYKVKPGGEVILLTDSLTRPNGIAFFPGEEKLIVANSDSDRANWYIYDVAGDSLKNGRVFFSVPKENLRLKGLPDGLKIDKKGNVYATGPGGVYIFNKDAKWLGMVKLPQATSNCALSPDEKTLYITNHMYVLRLNLRS